VFAARASSAFSFHLPHNIHGLFADDSLEFCLDTALNLKVLDAVAYCCSYDNVGGEALEAALDNCNLRARVVRNVGQGHIPQSLHGTPTSGELIMA
jgi:hypothetical protein